MKKERLLAGALCLALLAGCGGKESEPSDAPGEDDLAWQAAGIRRDYPLATLDGEEIPAEEYLFWLARVIQEAKSYGELSTDEDWEEHKEDLKSMALETAELYAMIRHKADEYGIALTQEQIEEADKELADAAEKAGGEETYRAYLDSYGISWEGFRALNQVTYLHQGLMEKLSGEGELTVTQEDRDSFISGYVEGAGLYAAKHILILTRRENADGSGYEEFSDEEKAEALKKAQGLLEQIRSAEDKNAVFDELMNEYSEDGRDPETGKLYSPEGYNMVYPGQMVAEFEEASLALEEGEISDIVTTDYGYHIIMRLPLDLTELQAFAQENLDEEYKLEQKIQQWIEEAEVKTTQAYEDLDPKKFHDNLTAMNEAREQAKESAQPSQSPEPTASPAE